MSYAPVVLFAFNRTIHLEKALKSLEGCTLFELSSVYIHIDGPRQNFVGDVESVEAVRELCFEFAENHCRSCTVDGSTGYSYRHDHYLPDDNNLWCR